MHWVVHILLILILLISNSRQDRHQQQIHQRREDHRNKMHIQMKEIMINIMKLFINQYVFLINLC
jgi:hypothetical protein